MSVHNQRLITFMFPMLMLSLLVILMVVFEKHTTFYMDGVRDTQKEAYEHGLMIKTIDKNDKVVYSWKELHNIGYEEEK